MEDVIPQLRALYGKAKALPVSLAGLAMGTGRMALGALEGKPLPDIEFRDGNLEMRGLSGMGRIEGNPIVGQALGNVLHYRDRNPDPGLRVHEQEHAKQWERDGWPMLWMNNREGTYDEQPYEMAANAAKDRYHAINNTWLETTRRARDEAQYMEKDASMRRAFDLGPRK